ncbi:hypothetical protein ACFE04_031289 [Oxalis oulophora]
MTPPKSIIIKGQTSQPKDKEVVESSSTKVSPPPSLTMPKIKHAHTRIVPTKWAKVGFPKLSSSTLIGIGLETKANHIIPSALAPSPNIITITRREAEESLRAILKGSKEEDDNGVNISPSLDKRSSLYKPPLPMLEPSTMQFLKSICPTWLTMKWLQHRKGMMPTQEMVEDTPQTGREVLALRKAIRESYALSPHELKMYEANLATVDKAMLKNKTLKSSCSFAIHL